MHGYPGIKGRDIGASQKNLPKPLYFNNTSLLPLPNAGGLVDSKFFSKMARRYQRGTPSFLDTQLITFYIELRVPSNSIDELAHEQK